MSSLIKITLRNEQQQQQNHHKIVCLRCKEENANGLKFFFTLFSGLAGHAKRSFNALKQHPSAKLFCLACFLSSLAKEIQGCLLVERQFCSLFYVGAQRETLCSEGR